MCATPNLATDQVIHVRRRIIVNRFMYWFSRRPLRIEKFSFACRSYLFTCNLIFFFLLFFRWATEGNRRLLFDTDDIDDLYIVHVCGHGITTLGYDSPQFIKSPNTTLGYAMRLVYYGSKVAINS